MPNFGWTENIEIIVRNSNGEITDSTHFHNQVTDVGLNWIADSLRKSTQDNEIKYLGWGSSNLAVSTAHTSLSSEFGRKEVTSQSSSNVGVCYTVCYIAPTEGVGTIAELAWFAGSSAEATADTGRMISRVLYSRTKTPLESITITRKDSFTT
jgi:hypothetical protein